MVVVGRSLAWHVARHLIVCFAGLFDRYHFGGDLSGLQTRGATALEGAVAVAREVVERRPPGPEPLREQCSALRGTRGQVVEVCFEHGRWRLGFFLNCLSFDHGCMNHKLIFHQIKLFLLQKIIQIIIALAECP